jgi:hypothetical protein
MHIHEFSISGADPEFRVQATSKRTLYVSLMDAKPYVRWHPLSELCAIACSMQASQLTWVEATVATTKRENDDEDS